MNPFARTSALFVPVPLTQLNPFEISSRLGEPLWSNKAIAQRRRGSGALPQHALQVASLCAQLDIVLERERKESEPALTALVTALLQRMRSICTESLGSELEEFLQQTGLLVMFSEVGTFLGIPPADYNMAFPQPREYLHQIGLVSQTIQMCKQLSMDLLPGANQKYLAHQVALLYQCLNFIGPAAAPFKKRVEAEFQNIKGSTEQSATPGLSEFHQQWLRELIEDIIEDFSALGPTLLRKAYSVTQHIAALYTF